MKSEMTAVEAAKVLGVGRLYVYELLASGRIKGRKVLGRWLLPSESVEQYRREHPRIGRARESHNACG